MKQFSLRGLIIDVTRRNEILYGQQLQKLRTDQ